MSSSEAPIEARLLDVGEVPVDVVKVSDVPTIGGRGVQLNAPTLRDALAFLFVPQGGEGKWTKKADMPITRVAFSTSAVNGKIYAIGGDNGAATLSTVEELDLGFAGEGEEGQGVEAKGKHATTWGKMKK